MKFWQFFFIMAAVYVAQEASTAMCVTMGGIFTIAALLSLWRNE